MDTQTVTWENLVCADDLLLYDVQGLALVPREYCPPAALVVENTPLPDPQLLTILTASALGYPVQAGSVTAMAQVGRFVRVRYAPLNLPDPDTLVALCREAGAFHTALRAFAAVRRAIIVADLAAVWYQQALAAAQGLIAPLRALQATPLEADFVLRWALYACATGQRI